MRMGKGCQGESGFGTCFGPQGGSERVEASLADLHDLLKNSVRAVGEAKIRGVWREWCQRIVTIVCKCCLIFNKVKSASGKARRIICHILRHKGLRQNPRPNRREDHAQCKVATLCIAVILSRHVPLFPAHIHHFTRPVCFHCRSIHPVPLCILSRENSTHGSDSSSKALPSSSPFIPITTFRPSLPRRPADQ